MMWKEIKDFDRYMISCDGQVLSLRWEGKPRMLKKIIEKKGYCTFSLFNGVKDKRMKAHRLVALNFIPNPENKSQVNHIDGNKKNNCISNLEWCTQSENMIYAHNTGLMNGLKGENNIFSKLTEKDVLEIRKMISLGVKQNRIAGLFNVDDTAISKIKLGKTWSHI